MLYNWAKWAFSRYIIYPWQAIERSVWLLTSRSNRVNPNCSVWTGFELSQKNRTSGRVRFTSTHVEGRSCARGAPHNEISANSVLTNMVTMKKFRVKILADTRFYLMRTPPAQIHLNKKRNSKAQYIVCRKTESLSRAMAFRAGSLGKLDQSPNARANDPRAPLPTRRTENRQIHHA